MKPLQLIVAEPRGTYDRRPLLVVDASVLAATLFAEPTSVDVRGWMSGHRLCAPVLLNLEIANIAHQKVRRKLMSIEAAHTALDEFEAIDLATYAVPTLEAFGLARHFGLSAYDAAYLWLASALGTPLATYDRQLGNAARIHLHDEPPSTDSPA